ncbi:hypothetical protein F2Q70_00005451 [Brassica cretica]|uniref:Uncharacterized protein n=1 Tax=Brassica cretica TaxID=69181 RepID=A0A8S9ITL8_BRACR|nr:hypothetical protein F2Q70_00005451 [Brassica cretica]
MMSRNLRPVVFRRQTTHGWVFLPASRFSLGGRPALILTVHQTLRCYRWLLVPRLIFLHEGLAFVWRRRESDVFLAFRFRCSRPAPASGVALVLRWSSGLSLWEAVAFIAHVSPALSPGFGGGVASFRWLYDPVAFAFYEHFFVWMVFTDLSLLMAELRRNPSGGGDGFRIDACLRIVC